MKFLSLSIFATLFTLSLVAQDQSYLIRVVDRDSQKGVPYAELVDVLDSTWATNFAGYAEVSTSQDSLAILRNGYKSSLIALNPATSRFTVTIESEPIKNPELWIYPEELNSLEDCGTLDKDMPEEAKIQMRGITSIMGRENNVDKDCLKSLFAPNMSKEELMAISEPVDYEIHYSIDAKGNFQLKQVLSPGSAGIGVNVEDFQKAAWPIQSYNGQPFACDYIQSVKIIPSQYKDQYIDERMPQYKGGEAELFKLLGSNIRYPEKALKDQVMGVVFLTFVVNTEGYLEDIKVQKGVSPEIDAEAIRVIKMTDGNWEPAIINNKKKDLQYSLPVRFMLR